MYQGAGGPILQLFPFCGRLLLNPQTPNGYDRCPSCR